MTNYSADGSNVVDRWYKDGYLYCAFVDGTIMEYGRNKIPERYIYRGYEGRINPNRLRLARW